MLAAADFLSSADAQASPRPEPVAAESTNTPGSGLVELARVGGRTEVVRLRSCSPLRLLCPRSRSTAAWVVAGSYGGGLVSGDVLDVQLTCGPGTSAVLGTQATTKVYRARRPSSGGVAVRPNTCRQVLRATLAHDATLVSWPDPVTCFAGSRYAQEQAFDLSATASLLAVDWVTSGRMARGERWAFDRYQSVTAIRVDGRLRLRESTTLDPADGSLDAVARTGGYDCLGMAWLVGPAFAAVADHLLATLGRSPIDPRRPVLFGISPAGHEQGPRGATIRFAARSTNAAWHWLREQLAGGLAVVGVDPWSRRG